MGAELVESIGPLRRRLAEARRSNATIALVPTMGALHAGHGRLIEQARRDCHTVAVSIFVNPLQFDRPEDLRRYPRTLDADRRLCDERGVDVVFAPSVEEMYPVQPACTIDVGRLADHLCGKYRPGHFRSVATVVVKLFGIVQPDRAYFGEKDAQQLAIIRRLVVDLNVPVQVVGVPTVREPDGLALSSRNTQLGPAERQSAIALFRALQSADRRIAAGDTDPEHVKRMAAAEIPRDNPSLRLEYLEIVDPDEMQPVALITGPVRVAGALWVGATRLIDNVLSTATT
ncbi:MAG: pantoate--beta-alanine ligase [Acidobacteria bacterium]|nr:pantoate--beta-alanine ligase [Acidobacteriota bacterium]